MVDVVDKLTRSRMMSGIKGKDTAPEILIRRELHCRGFRYKLHAPEIPGKPDLVFPKYRAVIEVNGCFWHGHKCKLFKWPKTRPDFWREKIEGNIKRDRRNVLERQILGWRTITIWECATRKKDQVDAIVSEIIEWLESGDTDHSIPDD